MRRDGRKSCYIPFMAGERLDKWLWAARFFKTRALAAHACGLGRIEVRGAAAKPAREIHPGDQLDVTSEAGRFQIEVLALSEIRGPAAVAQTLYREDEAGRLARLAAAAERKALYAAEGAPPTRPNKRDRRLIHRFRGNR